MKAIEIFTAIDKQCFLRKEEPILFADAKMVRADSPMVIYLCALNAASHVGMSDIAEHIVQKVPSSFLVHPHIQNTLIDMWVSEHAYARNTTPRYRHREKSAVSTGRRKSSTPFLTPTTLDTLR